MTKISFNITAILTIVLPLVFILGNEQFINNYIAIYGINFFHIFNYYSYYYYC